MLASILVFILLLVLNVPIAFVLLGSSLIYGLMNPVMASIFAQRMSTSLESFPLLAIPFFVVAGAAMARGGIAEKIYGFAESLVGHWRGGLAQIAVINSLFLGAMSGSANADAAIDARSLVPIMRKQGYSNAFASVVSATSGAIAPMMPPSIGLIIYGLLTDTSIGKLFTGGLIPALLATLALMLTVRRTSIRRNYGKLRETRMPVREVASRARAALWALGMPVMLIVGLRLGWFTPTELGAIAALYAFIVGLFVYRGFAASETFDILRESAYTTANVMFIVASAAAFSLVLTLEQAPQALVGAILSLTDNKYVILLLINIILLLLGTVLEGLAVMVILAPMLVEITRTVGIDPIHFGVIVVLNITIGAVHPPVGTVMYTVCSITGCSVEDFTRELIPFLVALLGVLMFLTFVPAVVTFLPDLLF